MSICQSGVTRREQYRFTRSADLEDTTDNTDARVGQQSCSACGYDLAGLDVPRCPECGKDTTQQRRRSTVKTGVPLLGLGLSAAAAAVLTWLPESTIVLALFIAAVGAHWVMWIWLYISVLQPSTLWGLAKAVVLGSVVAALLILAGLGVLMFVHFDLE